jgi:hypothetical protein
MTQIGCGVFASVLRNEQPEIQPPHGSWFGCLRLQFNSLVDRSRPDQFQEVSNPLAAQFRKRGLSDQAGPDISLQQSRDQWNVSLVQSGVERLDESQEIGPVDLFRGIQSRRGDIRGAGWNHGLRDRANLGHL